MKSLLVTGSNGQLGTALKTLSEEIKLEDYKFFFTDIDTLNICDINSIKQFIKNNKIDIIVNCAAYTAVDRAEDEILLCNDINHIAVKNIGEVAAAENIKVIHISTDYVFDGLNTKPYLEDDPTNPKSVYGVTKLSGEKALTAICPQSIIVRTAWLYSETGHNFVKTMLALGNTKKSVNVVADQTGSPTYAEDLAKCIIEIINNDTFIPGIYHFTDNGSCTWFQFALKIFELSGLPCKVIPIKTSEYPVKAPRPANSVLDTTKIKKLYNIITPQWEESLAKCICKLNSSITTI